MHGLKHQWLPDPCTRELELVDYEGAEPRWCPGCGDHAVLGALRRLARDEQLEPEKTVVVSGIGCSSRFPHYVKTYGFHGLHGRPLPVASGIRARRPDLHLFVITGDGDCCAIGTAHWIHAVRYNMRMVVLLLDNNIYGLTKKQTSPTTAKGKRSNTHPEGALLEPLNPLTVTLGITNASFVAQTIDWNVLHLQATLAEAFHHPGLSFVRVIQRCPHFVPEVCATLQKDPASLTLLEHEEGVPVGEVVGRIFPNHLEHDPGDLVTAREIAGRTDTLPIGCLYRNPEADRYDHFTAQGVGLTQAERLAAIRRQLEHFEI